MPESSPNFADIALSKTRVGAITTQTLLWVVGATMLLVPTTDADYDGDLSHFIPLLVGRDGQTFMVLFTSADHVGDYAGKAAGFIQLYGHQLYSMLPPDTGIVLNPGGSLSFELPPIGVAAIKAEIFQ